MPILKRKSLAGTNGIPTEAERAYVQAKVTADPRYPNGLRPTRITWSDGRFWEVRSVLSSRSFGREIFGNLCVHYSVSIARRAKDIWWESGRWFVRRTQKIQGSAHSAATAHE